MSRRNKIIQSIRSGVLALTRICIVSAVVFTAVVSQAINVCKQCAREQPDGVNFCSHCGANMKADGKPDSSKKRDDKDADKYSYPIEVTSDFNSALLAKTAMSEQTKCLAAAARFSPAAGVIFQRNADALAAISVPKSGASSGARVNLTDFLYTSKPCTVCGGSGCRSMTAEMIDGELLTLTKTGLSCPRCDGRKSIKVFKTPAEIRSGIAEGVAAAEKVYDKNKMVRVGDVYVSQKLKNLLTTKSEARLRRAGGGICSECFGIGKIRCAKCNGEGLLDCPVKECDDGYILRDEKNAVKIKEVKPIRHRTICKKCDRKGYIRCSDCAGIGATKCSSCEGRGRRANCVKCRGTGVSKCVKCEGSGKTADGDKCASCHGDGVIMCTGCGGDGYGRR